MDGGWTRGRHIQSPRHGHARARHRRVAATPPSSLGARRVVSATPPPGSPEPTTAEREHVNPRVPLDGLRRAGRRAHGLCPAVPVCLRPAVLKRKRTLIGSSGHGTAWYGRHGAGRAAGKYERMEARGLNWDFFQIFIKFLI